MSDTNIEWTDKTWNPVVGCAMVSPGCAHCYAETMSKRLAHMAIADDAKMGAKPTRKDHYLKVIDIETGRWNTKIELVPEALTDPLKWKSPHKVFVNSMSDLFHKDVPLDFIDKVFAVMALTPRHTYQILTKRPERMAEYISARPDSTMEVYRYAMGTLIHQAMKGAVGESTRFPLPNVWLGTSAEDQQRLDERAPHLEKLAQAGWTTFISVEPMLGPVVLPNSMYCDDECAMSCWLDWCIIGGESGKGARPFSMKAAECLAKQCEISGVKCFMKQLGANAIWSDGLPYPTKDSHGGDPEEWPATFPRCREFPSIPPVAAAAVK